MIIKHIAQDKYEREYADFIQKKRIKNDQECLSLIEKKINNVYTTQKESSELLVLLENYQAGIANLITQSKTSLTPEEILKRAREENKPICL